MDVGRILIVAGIVLPAAGLLWPYLTRLGLGRLPSDVVVEQDNFRFYFPLAISMLISIVLTALSAQVQAYRRWIGAFRCNSVSGTAGGETGTPVQFQTRTRFDARD